MLIILGICSSFVMPFIGLACYRDLCKKFCWGYNYKERKLKYILVSIVYYWIFFLAMCFIIKSLTVDKKIPQYNKGIIIQEKNSLDLLIEERAKTKFDESIFAGIIFGDSKRVVEQKLEKYKKSFGNAIYTDSSCYEFSKVDTQYYNDSLYSLSISFQSYLEKDFWDLFQSKYGQTRDDNSWCWFYSDARIVYRVEMTSRPLAIDNEKYRGKNFYYDESNKLTTDPGHKFIRSVTYTSLAILSRKEKAEELERNKRLKEQRDQQRILDSISDVEILKAKEKAKKLSKKQHENI